MANEGFRAEVAGSGLKLWQIAQRWPLSDTNFSKLLRRELTTEELEKGRGIIAQLVSEMSGETGEG